MAKYVLKTKNHKPYFLIQNHVITPEAKIFDLNKEEEAELKGEGPQNFVEAKKMTREIQKTMEEVHQEAKELVEEAVKEFHEEKKAQKVKDDGLNDILEE